MALNQGLRGAMEADPGVLVMGADVGKLGGVFRITDGLEKDFGEQRVLDTPLAESGIIGTAVGLAIARVPAGVRDPVRRFRLPGVRPDRVATGEAALPHPGVRSQMPVGSGSRSAAASARWSTTRNRPSPSFATSQACG